MARLLVLREIHGHDPKGLTRPPPRAVFLCPDCNTSNAPRGGLPLACSLGFQGVESVVPGPNTSAQRDGGPRSTTRRDTRAVRRRRSVACAQAARRCDRPGPALSLRLPEGAPVQTRTPPLRGSCSAHPCG